MNNCTLTFFLTLEERNLEHSFSEYRKFSYELRDSLLLSMIAYKVSIYFQHSLISTCLANKLALGRFFVYETIESTGIWFTEALTVIKQFEWAESQNITRN